MKVVIGGKVYDSHECPIVLRVSHDERHQIGNMLEDCFYYASIPSGYTNRYGRGFFDKAKTLCEEVSDDNPA